MIWVTEAGNELVYKGGRRRDRRIRFDLPRNGWEPSSQDCQRASLKSHAFCDVKSCGCLCHKELTFYTYQKET